MRTVVVVGAGLAGHRAAAALRRLGFEGSVVVLGAEKHFPYDRPPLSKQLLGGSMTPGQCEYPIADLDVIWRLGTAATSLDVDVRRVGLADGSDVDFDGLVIATGRRARPWSGVLPAAGVWTLRSVEDALTFRDAVSADTRVVIIGAGFIGCEVASTLRATGVGTVTLVDVADRPMPVLGPVVGEYAANLHRAHGVGLRLGRTVRALEGSACVTGVVLDDGERLAADVVLVATGSVPNTEWLASSGLTLDGGCVACDEGCFALDTQGRRVPNIVVAGDVAARRHRHATGNVCIEHWSNAREMAEAAVENLLGAEAVVTVGGVPTFWSDQHDVKIKSAGYLRAADRWSVVHDDPAKPSLVVEACRGEELVGAVVFNRNRAIINYQRQLAQGAPTP